MSPQGNIAVITGASRGLGFALAKQLGGAGAQIVAIARTARELERLDDAIMSAGGPPAVLVPLDLAAGHEAIDRLGATLFERFGRVDMFIHAAAMLGTLGPLAHTDPNEMQRVMNVNALCAYRFFRSFDALLRAAPAARILTLDCTLGDDTIAYWGAYRASKSALRTLTHTYAHEVTGTNIGVIHHTPAPMDTVLYTTAFPGADPATLAAVDAEAEKILRLLAV